MPRISPHAPKLIIFVLDIRTKISTINAHSCTATSCGESTQRIHSDGFLNLIQFLSPLVLHKLFEKRASIALASFSVGELVASGGGRIQPLTTPCATALAIVVMVIIHLHIATICTPIGAAGTTGELGLLIQLDSFLDIDLFHSVFPFEVEICPAIPCR